VEEVIKAEIDHGRAQTFGGYIVDHLGRIPVSGETLVLPEGKVIIREVRRHKVQTLELQLPPKEAERVIKES